MARIGNGKIWRNWRNTYPILISTWPRSMSHIPCSTAWTKSSEPHLVFAYCYLWNWKNLQIDLSRKQSCIKAAKRFQQKSSWNVTAKDKNSHNIHKACIFVMQFINDMYIFFLNTSLWNPTGHSKNHLLLLNTVICFEL